MTPEAQQIAIAESCGASKSLTFDYLHDLNAMHSAEATLNRGQRGIFRGHLADMFPRDEDGDTTGWEGRFGRAIRATAAQRAEAFLRTIGKWED